MSVEEQKNVAAPAPIHRAEGVTAAERHLKRLADRSFLSLWSYSGVYRDQGHSVKGGDGKEICDLLVVFENHVIIFSDKDCAFPNTGNLELDWSRWFKRAIQKSAEQTWGGRKVDQIIPRPALSGPRLHADLPARPAGPGNG
jgi:hypothetical protein